MNEKKLTIEEAYLAMLAYLEEYYNRSKSDDLAIMLGGIQYLGNGHTMDQAAWNDWQKSVNQIIENREDIR